MATCEKYTVMELGLLLCLRAEGGLSLHPLSHKYPSIAIEAGIILELVLRGNVTHTANNHFVISNPTPTGNELLDEALILMQDISDASIGDWVIHMNGTLLRPAGIRNLSGKVFQMLADKKVVDKTNILMGHKYPFANEKEINDITAEIKDAIMSPTIDNLSPKMICVLGLFQALDKPFHHLMVNALDIKRIYPDKTELANARKNLAILLAVDNENDPQQLAEDGKKIVSRVTTVVGVQLIKRLIICIFCPVLAAFVTVHTIAEGVKEVHAQKVLDKECDQKKQEQQEQEQLQEEKK